MKLKQFVLLSILTVFVLTISTGCSVFGGVKDVSATLTESETTINVKSGEAFKIVLESNMTTGYGWVWKNKDNTPGITFLSSEYKTSPGSKGRTGAGGHETWQLVANEEGTMTLEFIYVFQGRLDEQPAKQIIFNVNVSP